MIGPAGVWWSKFAPCWFSLGCWRRLSAAVALPWWEQNNPKQAKKWGFQLFSLKHGINMMANELLSRRGGKIHFKREDRNKFLLKHFSTKYFFIEITHPVHATFKLLLHCPQPDFFWLFNSALLWLTVFKNQRKYFPANSPKTGFLLGKQVYKWAHMPRTIHWQSDSAGNPKRLRKQRPHLTSVDRGQLPSSLMVPYFGYEPNSTLSASLSSTSSAGIWCFAQVFH